MKNLTATEILLRQENFWNNLHSKETIVSIEDNLQKLIGPMIDEMHKIISDWHGFCPKCGFGIYGCCHCGGSGVKRDILHQTF